MENNSLCYRSVGGVSTTFQQHFDRLSVTIVCARCNCVCIRNGHDAQGKQRYRCKECKKTRVGHYTYKACQAGISNTIATLLCEGCGIRGIARILSISPVTVLKKIIEKAKSITKPALFKNRSYEMDEMRTFIGSKSKLYWVAYAIDNESKQVADFKVGARTNKTLRGVVDTLLLSEAKRISTDDLNSYRSLIPAKLHSVKKNGINLIERMNLNVRTHLKRLNRRSICYSKSLRVLTACLKIYWWGDSVAGELC